MFRIMAVERGMDPEGLPALLPQAGPQDVPQVQDQGAGLKLLAREGIPAGVAQHQALPGRAQGLQEEVAVLLAAAHIPWDAAEALQVQRVLDIAARKHPLPHAQTEDGLEGHPPEGGVGGHHHPLAVGAQGLLGEPLEGLLRQGQGLPAPDGGGCNAREFQGLQAFQGLQQFRHGPVIALLPPPLGLAQVGLEKASEGGAPGRWRLMQRAQAPQVPQEGPEEVGQIGGTLREGSGRQAVFPQGQRPLPQEGPQGGPLEAPFPGPEAPLQVGALGFTGVETGHDPRPLAEVRQLVQGQVRPATPEGRVAQGPQDLGPVEIAKGQAQEEQRALHQLLHPLRPLVRQSPGDLVGPGKGPRRASR